jgi:hypothetical protein
MLLTFLLMGPFEIHRSGIPTHIFNSIVMDTDSITDGMGRQCGWPSEKWTVRASPNLFSPVRIIYITLVPPSKVDHNQQVFNHLVKLFNSTLRISSETTGSHYFLAFGVIALLAIEIKLQAGKDVERLDAIAQVIAECESKHHVVFYFLFTF